MALAVLGTGWALTRIVYQLRYRHTHQHLLREKERVRERWVVWIVGVTVIPISIVWLFTPWIRFAQWPCPPWLVITGGAVGAAALALFIWTHRTLQSNWSPVLQIRVGHELITSGPYRWVAHPMYTAMALGVVGNALLTANFLLTLLHVAGLGLLLWVRLRDEELLLEEQFGDRYRQFLLTRWRLIPFIW
ncbi:MAG: isoprenylcysteine carboxylmethyltransferase family protein [Cyclobacteriaceae bacterium]|nr:isoprenylcysteine carboxylmethyltransferase family protein [Cyclobacteriaceae bacterium]